MKQKYRFDIKRMSADCEANYARLCRLLPEVLAQAAVARKAVGDGSGRSDFDPLKHRMLIELSVPNPAAIAVEVIEQCKFTTTLAMALELQAEMNGESIGEEFVSKKLLPFSGMLKLSVRMYHDVMLAEVIAFSGKRTALASYEYPNETMFQPDEKAQQNQFLAEVLSLGLKKGLAVLPGMAPDVVSGKEKSLYGRLTNCLAEKPFCEKG